MKRLAMTHFSLHHPGWVMTLIVLGTLFFGSQFPKVQFDNDPENMLAPDEPVRVFHHKVKEQFNLYDFVIVGVVNTAHVDGVFNVDTLGRIDRLTHQLISLHRNESGQPAVTNPGPTGETIMLDLHPTSLRKRILGKAFHQDPTRLFDDEGHSAIIAAELISPSVVDNIKQAEQGQLKIEYLMENLPTTRDEALVIRDDAIHNPLYNGTLVSEDGKALCIYIPILDKTFSYNVATLVEALTDDWHGHDQVHITGLPVAEDTFGTEMLVQMATSAPMAGLAIFVLLLLFFRRFSLVVPPMILAMVTVIFTMGLLIGQGFTVHIMSSMIAIFLMPIAVADSVHVLSEFYDTYGRFNNKVDTVRHVVAHLFIPMLYTSLTTMAGFASLALTPIPPVRVFGLHVAFGVGLAWVLTMTLIPACIMLFVSEESLKRDKSLSNEKHRSRLEPILQWMGERAFHRWAWVLGITAVLLILAGFGISRIQVNDNPVRWFTQNHRIRVADTVLNEHFGGTYTAYLTLSSKGTTTTAVAEQLPLLRDAATRSFGKVMPDALASFMIMLEQQADQSENGVGFFAGLAEAAGGLDQQASQSWNHLADTVLYLDPAGLTLEQLTGAVGGADGVSATDVTQLLRDLEQDGADLTGSALQDKALEVTDRYTQLSFRSFVEDMEATLTAAPFKQPQVLQYIETLQAHLDTMPRVGKTSSAVDALKKAAYELHYADASTEAQNQSFYNVPPTPSAVAQVFTQLEGMKKKDSLFHLVTKDYRHANIWVQLTSGDNTDMEAVVQAVDQYLADVPPPAELDVGWAGLTYINIVWQKKMVVGMLGALASSFVVVLGMMILLFRSPLFGLLSMIPLSATIALTYGIIGWVGKDYDMPVAVLSALTLGLSIDFAIHFLQRSRETVKAKGAWRAALPDMFREPAMAISRNAIVISVGFTPLLVAPLLPYKTVGFFLATIMVVSWLATLFVLTALATMLQNRLFSKPTQEGES